MVEIVQPASGIFRRKKVEVQEKFRDDIATLASTIDHQGIHLESYSHVAKAKRTDIIECVLRMRNTKATNPRDFGYGILGIANFPSQPISVEAWLEADHRENFIPVDYNASLDTIWCILTRVLLFQAGLSLVAKFKINKRHATNDQNSQLPSWAVDWRLAAHAFCLKPRYTLNYDSDTPICLDRQLGNIWDYINHEPYDSTHGTMSGRKNKSLAPGKAPEGHREFCNDNAGVNQKDPFKLILRGRIINAGHVSFAGKAVKVRTIRRGSPIEWHVPVDAHRNDLVVIFNTSQREKQAYTGHYSWFMQAYIGDVWLLRPSGNNEFNIVACICPPGEILPLYESWVLRNEFLRDGSDMVPLTADQKSDVVKDLIKKMESILGEETVFVII